ncbi:hypothetical protein [Paenarthrobacter ureafaciens]|uniref:hypothetical protein n=1 Tax=Paenarthrobacter ureafaciens TaxID=37931 RepID=UPI00140940FD|nr:hypothetical protein [Paenarthrobacter ureafaciens]MCX8456052.1 hypothetical protein [Paenarthrobacter ureafaciens]MCY0971717.1 hypothetical protein [Paenarthrobacter ureafaciens]
MSTQDALLKQVSITATDQNLVARFELDGNVPDSGAYVVGLVAVNEDYSNQRRLGIEFMNGEAISFFSFNHALSAEENYDIKGVEHSGNVITGSFPASAIQGLPKGHVMTAFSEADGRDFQSGVPVKEEFQES